MTWFYAFCDSGWIYGFLLLYWESWVLPCSPSCMAESTHSSPGPMLPQSTTDPLRTLEYISAAEQGSRVRGHKKSGYTCKHGDFSSLTAVVRPSSVQEQETWLLTLCATDMNFSELFKHDVAPSYYLETQTKKKSVPQRVHNGILYNFETIQKEYLKLLGNTSSLLADEISLHHTPALQEEVGQDKASFTYNMSLWFHILTMRQSWLAKTVFPGKKKITYLGGKTLSIHFNLKSMFYGNKEE